MKKILLFGLAVTLFAPYWMRAAAADAFRISVLSSRPDTVTGGNALVSIEVPQGEALDKIAVVLNGTDVAANLNRDPSTHALTGLVSGLKIGEN